MAKNSRWRRVSICRRRCGVWMLHVELCCPECGGRIDRTNAEVFVRRRSGWRGKWLRMTYLDCPAADAWSTKEIE